MRMPLVLLLILTTAPAFANDSMAELKTGGIALMNSTNVTMASEDLFISAEEVRVTYEFINNGDHNITTLVAFPMPDVQGDPYDVAALPDYESDNFLDFSVSIAGRPVAASVEKKAFAGGLDITRTLEKNDVPLFPYGDRTYGAVAALPEDVLADWTNRGIIIDDEYDIGEGMQHHPSPFWTFKSTYWWWMTFPAGETIRVEHRYKPSVGGTAGLSFLNYADGPNPNRKLYEDRFCMDADFELSVEKKIAAIEDGYLYESRIAYVLSSGRNWFGPIGRFHLTIDKGAPENLLSFCGKNVKKTGATTFEVTETDFRPERDLDILILRAGQ